MIARWIFTLLFTANFLCCNAGFLGNLREILWRKLVRRKTFDAQSFVESYSSTNVGSSVSSKEIISDLTTSNEMLRAQVLSLRTFVNMQKIQLQEIRKEKEALRRFIDSQTLIHNEQKAIDQETIKSELRSVFEEEKVVMINSFQEEKTLLREDYVVEIRDMKLQQSKQLEEKSVALEISQNNVKKQLNTINELVKSDAESTKNIAHLKQSLKAKEAAMAEMSRASAKATEEASKAASSPPVSKTKKVSDSTSPTKPMKSGTLSGKIPGGSAKPAPSTSMKNRAALPGAQNVSPNNRGGL